jgi:hypothetical protein
MSSKILSVLLLVVIVTGVAVSQDLKIDYQLNTVASDPTNYFSFSGPIAYLAADKDKYDTKTNASTKHSKDFFQAYRYDVKGKSVISDGLRGIFLFGTANFKDIQGDMINASKVADGTITIQYVHRGTAYMIVTDKSGKINMKNGIFKKRPIGYIKGEGPQVLSTDFSSNGTAAKIDWNKVWDDKIPGGKEITSGVTNKTGMISPDTTAADSMFYWDGDLQVTFDKNILKISGSLTPVKR